MTKRNLKPQQAAPVQREINTTASEGGTGLTPLVSRQYDYIGNGMLSYNPFAGDDAE